MRDGSDAVDVGVEKPRFLSVTKPDLDAARVGSFGFDFLKADRAGWVTLAAQAPSVTARAASRDWRFDWRNANRLSSRFVACFLIRFSVGGVILFGLA
jgi:hypothetical protein